MIGFRRSELCIVFLFFLLSLGSGLCQGPSDQLDSATVRHTVESVANLVRDNYFDEELAASIADSLCRKRDVGEYDKLSTSKSVSDRLTQDLFDATKDKHLVVTALSTQSRTESTKSDDEVRAKRGQVENFGVRKVEILEGNVGYLQLTSFYRPEEASDAIAAAMHLLRNADVLIVDLRDNAGGSPDTLAVFVSYFFETPAFPLFRIVDRAGNSKVYSTSVEGLSDRNQMRPTYMLTSTQTFSAGEGAAFLFQEQDRAQVVGEVTAGAANPGRPYSVNPFVEITIPNGKVISARGKGNWEGRGVKPNIAVDSKDALHTAYALALSELLSRTTDPESKAFLKELVDKNKGSSAEKRDSHNFAP